MTTLLTETFDNQDLTYGGSACYDDQFVGTSAFDSSIKYAGAYSNKNTWVEGAYYATGTGSAASRWLFTASDRVYVSLYIRLGSDWVGSGQSYHPHLLFLLSDTDYNTDPYCGIATNYLNCYIEPHENYLRLIIADELQTVPVHGEGTFYNVSGRNFTLGQWYHIELWYKMNTPGQYNGELKAWIDGVITNINYINVHYRPVEYSTMKWRTFVHASWIGDTSPQTQSMWLDDIYLGTEYLSRGKGDLLSMPSSRLCNKTNVRRLHPKI